jgi:2-polyprenyl-3-methyl-5-hydroxy-6-metoxy-1,4-benzoquinol methylase
MAQTELSAAERAERERAAYDEDQVWEKSHAWNMRVRHVLEQPNTAAAERVFDDLLAGAVAGGGRALDVGAADGWSSKRVLDMGAGSVHGIDVGERAIAKAQRVHAAEDRLTFAVHDAQQPVEGEFDLVFGRSVLHHIDFREFLDRVWRDNLRPGGRIVFMEPLSHPFTLAFHRIVRSAHTPDERPITATDLRWMGEHLPGLEVIPVNCVSFATGIVSTFAFHTPDNGLTRTGDAIDRWLARRPRMRPYFRQGIITARKPG